MPAHLGTGHSLDATGWHWASGDTAASRPGFPRLCSSPVAAITSVTNSAALALNIYHVTVPPGLGGLPGGRLPAQGPSQGVGASLRSLFSGGCVRESSSKLLELSFLG